VRTGESHRRLGILCHRVRFTFLQVQYTSRSSIWFPASLIPFALDLTMLFLTTLRVIRLSRGPRSEPLLRIILRDGTWAVFVVWREYAGFTSIQRCPHSFLPQCAYYLPSSSHAQDFWLHPMSSPSTFTPSPSDVKLFASRADTVIPYQLVATYRPLLYGAWITQSVPPVNSSSPHL
jgi:hypothetical protein